MTDKEKEIADTLLETIKNATNEKPVNRPAQTDGISARTQAIDDYNVFISAACKRANIK